MKKIVFRPGFCIAVLCFLFIVSGCTVLVPSADTFSLLFLNAENLFDAVVDGTEYSDFLPDAGWTSAKVDGRLQNLGSALATVRPIPDVIALSEIENERVLDELFRKHMVDVSYPYRVFSGSPGGATGVALASRYPLTEVRTLQPRAGDFPPLRPILEVRIDVSGSELVVFVNHWKSKRGGAAATEPLRRAAAGLLAARLLELTNAEPDLPVVICGDLNEQPREAEHAGFAYPTAILPAFLVAEWLRDETGAPDWFVAEEPPAESILIADTAEDAAHLSEELGRRVFVDGWAGAHGDGSYWYFGSWEQIDHILLSQEEGERLSLPKFSVVRNRKFGDSQGRPVSWSDDPSGISDHLPVMVQWELNIP